MRKSQGVNFIMFIRNWRSVYMATGDSSRRMGYDEKCSRKESLMIPSSIRLIDGVVNCLLLNL